jgi:hypothetical protein
MPVFDKEGVLVGTVAGAYDVTDANSSGVRDGSHTKTHTFPDKP